MALPRMSRVHSHRRLSLLRTPSVSHLGRARLTWLIAAAACAAPVLVSSGPSAPATAAPQRSADYSRLEAEVLAALNRARTDPQGTAAGLDALTRYYDGKLLQRPSQPVPIQTVEGVSAAREAATAVRSQSPL